MRKLSILFGKMVYSLWTNTKNYLFFLTCPSACVLSSHHDFILHQLCFVCRLMPHGYVIFGSWRSISQRFHARALTSFPLFLLACLTYFLLAVWHSFLVNKFGVKSSVLSHCCWFKAQEKVMQQGKDKFWFRRSYGIVWF